MELKEAVASLGALAHPTRLAIFRMLVEAGPAGLAAGVIAGRLETPPATLSFHLKELCQSSLVQYRPSGRFLIYSVSFGAMAALIGYLSRDCCGGHPEVCQPLGVVVASPEPDSRRKPA